MESVYTYTIFFVLLGILAVPYWLRVARRHRDAQERLQKSERAGSLMPVTLHPHIDLEQCIGCASCVKVCPESVLAIVNGRAAAVNGLKCVGHALCAEVCPVGAIRMGFGTPKQGQEIPWYDDRFETNVPGLFIVGELGGIGLIKNAVQQSTKAMQTIATRTKQTANEFDVIIVGAGPAGMTAALFAHEQKLRYCVLEQGSIGGTIFHYPRQKLVLTSPVDLPLHGRLKVAEISKEELLSTWTSILHRWKLNIKTNTRVEAIARTPQGFAVKAGEDHLSATNVVLALGRRGTPRKLGVPGEELPKVAYQLIEAESYEQRNILIVGGGDSAIEAAVALARQRGNTITLSYRRSEFVRVKEKNEKHIKDMVHAKKIRVIFNSEVEEIRAAEATVKEASGAAHRLPNEFVFVFAGGEPPTQLLSNVGIRMRTSEHSGAAAA